MAKQFAILVSAMTLTVMLAPLTVSAQQVDYQRQIRPLLANHCFACHGADAEHREGGLRLDQRDSALKGGDDGAPAIVAGEPDESALIARIMSDDPDTRMPPPDSKKELTPAEKDLLQRWIAQGADYQPHWAFTAPKRPKVPKVKNNDWPRGEIDRFIMARLDREKLSPSPEADSNTLVRRLYLDILGLPPSPAEVEAFVADHSPEAYEQLVDRLLASPHYGERWGRIWLDGARYADSDGYEKDKPRFVWAYRDWVINALNRDLPYDQFVIEQIAGDLLPKATQDQVVATGLLRNSMINEEGGVDPEQFRMEAMFDRMDCIGKNVLALTVQCAQCHSHKYDPLTHEEYYRMFAFLNDTNEANVAVYTPQEQQRRAKILKQVRQLETRLKQETPDWQERMAAWEESVRGNQPRWIVVRPELDTSGGQKHTLLEDGSILAQGYAPTKHQTEFEITTSLQRITAVRLELLNDPNLPLGGPGRSIYGTSALSEFKLQVGPADGSSKMTLVKIASATADVNPPERDLDKVFDDRDGKKKRTTGPIAFAIDEKEETAWTSDLGPGRSNVPRKAVFVLAEPIETSGELTKINFRLVQKHGGWNSDDNQNFNLGRFRLSVTTAENVTADPLPAAVRALVSRPKARRSAAQQAAIFSHWRTTVDAWQGTNDKIEALWRQHPRGTSQLALGARKQMRQSHVLARGDFLKPTEPVDPGTPAFLHPLDVESENSDKPTRLDFARWLVSRNSPTAARAVVNRVWQAYFGTGLVSTSEDFGLQGEPPTHPELLDWLAVEFMEHGWSLKHLHRMIVSSAVYRQRSQVSAKLLERDPQNRLLARRAIPRRGRNRARHCLGGQRTFESRGGRAERVPPCPGVSFQTARQLWPEDLARCRRGRPLSPRTLHLPFPLGSLSRAANLRCADRRVRMCATRAIEYAVAGARDAERAGVSRLCSCIGAANVGRRWVKRRRTFALRVHCMHSPRARCRGSVAADVAPRTTTATVRERRTETLGTRGRRSRASARTGRRRDTRHVGRLDRRVTRVVES